MFDLPREIQTLIFSYDSTHKDQFNEVLDELKFTFLALRVLVEQVHPFLYLPETVDRFVKPIPKSFIKKLVYFTRAPVGKSYTKARAFRAILLRVISGSCSAPRNHSLPLWVGKTASFQGLVR